MTDDMSKRKQGRRSNGCGSLRLKGNIWFCRYSDGRGGRPEVSTHTSNYQEALKFLATFTEPIRKSQSDEEKKLRLRQQIEVIELRKELSEIVRLRLDELADKFLSHRNLADTTAGTNTNYRRQLNALVEAVAKVKPNAKYVDDVTSEVADQAMNELTKKWTAASYNLALATYRRAWKLFAKSNPFDKIEKRKIDKSRHRLGITVDEMRRIFKACRDETERAVWGVAAYTGLRCGDVCSLNYGALSKGLRTVTWTPMKTHKHMSSPLVIPICDALKRLLTKVLDWNKIGDEKYKDEPLWADYKARYDKGHVNEWFCRTLKKAGLSTSHKAEDGHRQVDTGFHITRHFFITNAPKYMDSLLVQKIAGHSSMDMTAHYFHANEDDMAEGLANMPDLNADAETHEKRSEEAEVIEMLKGMRKDGEGLVECLRRLIRDSVKVAC